MLTGKRVRLRAVERGDLPGLHELVNDLEVESRVSDQRPTPLSLARLQAQFDGWASDPPPGRVRFVVEAEGAVIGECGLHTFDDYSHTCHLGIAIRRDMWGQGFGTDAVRVLVDYAFFHLHVRKVCLEVLAHDLRAVGAYRKAGFEEEGRFRAQTWHRGSYRDVLRMAVFAPGTAAERPG